MPVTVHSINIGQGVTLSWFSQFIPVFLPQLWLMTLLLKNILIYMINDMAMLHILGTQ